ncbi:MAG: helix-turn-helix transcriptional regulator [Rhodobacteraceae bacterium]|nr:helix-turn-helix transcriptional regulator [Paracoccaceae bacterium]
MMKISKFVPEDEILKEFAKRLARIRKAQGYSQTDFAKEAGIGVATLRRIEGGQDSQFETWLKILKALDRVPALDALLPETFNSPMAEALAGKSRKRKKPPPSSGIVWGDEAK